MIQLLYGENEFEKRQKLAAFLGDTDYERYDGEELTYGRLRELLTGQTLFADDAPVVISELSSNPDFWTMLPELAENTDKTLFLLESKPDKRTKTYKWLAKHATTQECAPLTERQKPQLIKWCVERAKELNFTLTTKRATTLIDRLGYDQLRLDNFLQQLALSDQVTDRLIDDLVPLAKTENVFELFTAALNGDREKIHEIITYLEGEGGVDGAYQTLGLLASQLMNLNALVLTRGDTAAVANDFSVNPYVLKKLAPYARSLTTKQLARINKVLAEADIQMKTTSVAPWLLVETALQSIAQK